MNKKLLFLFVLFCSAIDLLCTRRKHGLRFDNVATIQADVVKEKKATVEHLRRILGLEKCLAEGFVEAYAGTNLAILMRLRRMVIPNLRPKIESYRQKNNI